MAVVLTEIFPFNPVETFNGSTITFEAFYFDDDGISDIDAVQWQVTANYDPIDPASATWSNIPGATDNQLSADETEYVSEYTTGVLNPGNSGSTYRIVITSSSGEIFFSDVYEIGGIGTGDFGYRTIEIVSNPEIILTDEDLGVALKIVSVGGSIAPVVAGFSYINRSVSSPSDLDGLTINWQVSYDFDPETGVGTWQNIVPPDLINLISDVGNASITEEVIDLGTNIYAKNSSLILEDLQFGANNSFYRVIATSTGVSNSPYLSGNVFQVLVNPEITIIEQPGESSIDTQSPAFCWSIGNPSNGVLLSETGGDIRVTINAISSAGFLSTLSYQWQYKAFFDNQLISGIPEEVISSEDNEEGFEDIEDGNGIYFNISENDSELRLTRLVYADRYVFRCIVGGSFEAPLTSDEYNLYLRDSQYTPEPITNQDFTSQEDFYGDIANRELFTDRPIRQLTISGGIDQNNYFGQAGSLLLSWQRLDPGLTDIDLNWVTIPEFVDYFPNTEFETSPFITGDPFIVTSELVTPFLRINQSDNITPEDQGARYRLKIESSAVYDSLDTSTGFRNYIPFYLTQNDSGQLAQLQIFREVFIISQPVSPSSFATSLVSFSTLAESTSIPLGGSISYTWQWALLDANGNAGTFSNLSNGEFFLTTGETGPTGSRNVVSGADTTTVTISNISAEIGNYAFRCIVDIVGSISSVTSDVVIVTVLLDIFTQISSINNLFLNEFETAIWEVSASSLSLGAIDYQWQKSLNGTDGWTDLTDTGNIVGSLTNQLTINSVQDPEDAAFYRLRLISFGGETAFSNVVRLNISEVDIRILQDLPNNRSYIEDEFVTPPFFVETASTDGEDVQYVWQYSRDGGLSYTNFSFGENFQLNSSNPYTPTPFFKTADPLTSWDNNLIRAQLYISSLPTNTFVYSNVLTLDVRRQFYYFADTATRVVQVNTPLSFDLNPTWTGSEDPTFSWEYSTNNGVTWQNVTNLSPSPANGSSILFIDSVPSSWNGYLFRCRVTLNLLDDLVYVRNNTRVVDSASGGVGFTASIRLTVVSRDIVPTYYSKENSKTGCAVGTVICIPKPGDFVSNNNTATTDDIGRWSCSLTGSALSSEDSTSEVTSGSVYNSNINFLNRGQNWINTSPPTPKWRLDRDRFPGFIELRGQWLLKSEFPLLYRIIGDEYGATSTKFKLPNPYGKKMMGTGAINSRLGNVSVIPLFGADGSSGGDRNKPGTIGGVYLYEKYRQLPPGSPGTSGSEDGTAGSPDPRTYAINSFRTDGWEDAQNVLNTNFSGNFSYTIGPLTESAYPTPAPHVHSSPVVGYFDGFKASADCNRSRGCLNGCSDSSNFLETNGGGGGDVDDGPSNVTEDSRPHTHGLDSVYRSSRNNPGLNHGEGKGDVSAPDTYRSPPININANRNSTRASMNSLVEPSTVTMSVASRNVFDGSLSFFLRNNEDIPLISDYFRLKWMIKAY